MICDSNRAQSGILISHKPFIMKHIQLPHTRLFFQLGRAFPMKSEVPDYPILVEGSPFDQALASVSLAKKCLLYKIREHRIIMSS